MISLTYRIDDEEYYRVTGVISGRECQAVAYNIKNKTSKDLLANAVTLPGSLMHWMNERYLREMKGYGPPDDIHWSDGARKILDFWEENGMIEERLLMPANEGFEGFMQFIRSFEFVKNHGERVLGIDPVFIEKTLYTDDFAGTGVPVAGTVDLIARLWLKGAIEKDGYFHECRHHRPHDPNCECIYQWVVTIIDWKYSVKKQASHSEQLSAYHWMSVNTGVMDVATENGFFPVNFENWSVLLKQPNHRVGYNVFKYKQDITGFLEGCKIMRDPKRITLNSRNMSLGLHGRCMFCAYPLSCPDRERVDEDQTVHITMIASPFPLSDYDEGGGN